MKVTLKTKRWTKIKETRPEVVNRCDSRLMTGFKTEFVTGHTHDSIHDRIHDGIHESEH